MATSLANAGEPFLTVAIPHYKHRRHLEVVLESIFRQPGGDFEILVSDDHSPDDSEDVIPGLLERSGRPFSYFVQPRNLGYDGNVRFCLSAARGKYVFLLGNDDALTEGSIAAVERDLRQLGCPEVAFTDFCLWDEPSLAHGRAPETRVFGSGPEVAADIYRSFSFVSGLIFDRGSALLHETDRWDSSIYYQIYLASRIIAAGGRVAAIGVPAVAKDVRVDGRTVETYATRLESAGWSPASRHSGLESVVTVACDAVLPFVARPKQAVVATEIVRTMLMTSYPYWVVEYRRQAGRPAGLGIARGLGIRALLHDLPIGTVGRVRLKALFLLISAATLGLPLVLLNALERRARFRARGSARSG